MLLYLLFIIITLIFCIKLDHYKLYKFNKSSKKIIWDEIDTYWPMVPFKTKNGHPDHNLWADGGCLEKYDLWLTNKYHIDSKSKELEKNPFFNWIINKESGYYIPQKNILSTNFENTSGVNINRNGKLDENIVFELSNIGILDKSKIESWWWGSCDLTAKASQMFEEPKYQVIDSGVTFTPKDIKGLLTIISKVCCINYKKQYHRYRDKKDTIIKKNGDIISGNLINFNIKQVNDDNIIYNRGFDIIKNIGFKVFVKLKKNESITIYPDEIDIIKRETSNDITASDFHTTIITWINKPFAMDIDKGPEVWNYTYGKVNIIEIEEKYYLPLENKLYSNFIKHNSFLNKFRVLNAELLKSDNETDIYRYWIIIGPFNNILESGWISENRPDFIWRCELNPHWEKIDYNKRNKYVIPIYVKDLYYKSIII